MTDNFQRLMDQAYDRYQANPGMTREQFVLQLSPAEAVAVHCGNMNYQVQNGGWMQWMDNGYMTEESIRTISTTLRQMDKWEVAKSVSSVFERAVEAMTRVASDEDYDELSDVLSPLDIEYYTLDQAFVKAVEEFLVENFKF